MRGYPRSEVSDVRTGIGPEHAFVERHAASLIELGDLRTIRERIEERLHWEYAKKTGTLLDESEPPPSLDFSDIENKYQSQVGGGASERDRFSSRKLGSTLMLIEVSGFSTSASRSAALIHRVQADMRALGGPTAYAPGMRVGFTGDVAISAEESAALAEDLTISTLLVVVRSGARHSSLLWLAPEASPPCSCRWGWRPCSPSPWPACRPSTSPS